jgi:hypothetical protein
MPAPRPADHHRGRRSLSLTPRPPPPATTPRRSSPPPPLRNRPQRNPPESNLIRQPGAGVARAAWPSGLRRLTRTAPPRGWPASPSSPDHFRLLPGPHAPPTRQRTPANSIGSRRQRSKLHCPLRLQPRARRKDHRLQLDATSTHRRKTPRTPRRGGKSTQRHLRQRPFPHLGTPRTSPLATGIIKDSNQPHGTPPASTTPATPGRRLVQHHRHQEPGPRTPCLRSERLAGSQQNRPQHADITGEKRESNKSLQPTRRGYGSWKRTS